MFDRILTLNRDQSILLFGARGTGKSTFLGQQFDQSNSFWIDLLDPATEERFVRQPEELRAIVNSLPKEIRYIVIDEIQKIPKLLDVVHGLIESTSERYFIMTGSSARKLKRGGANLLAGRAFVYSLFPFTYQELGNNFDLQAALQWGLLPRACLLTMDDEKNRFLQSYAHTYLKEEIWAEQFIRKLDPFRRFLEVAAQGNGQIVNYANIARDVGVDEKTVKAYFSILEDSLIGFFLEPFHHSFRKRLNQKPKFYFFDTGVTRALARLLTVPLVPKTLAYGKAFEHLVILECLKLSHYYNKDYRFSYLRTNMDVEVDLIVERPGKPLLFIEIKSSEQVYAEDMSAFLTLTQDFGECEAVCFSRDAYQKQLNHVVVFPWQKGIAHFFGK